MRALLPLVLLAACGPAVYKRDFPELTADQLVERLARDRDALTSWKPAPGDRAASVMDYFINGKHLKGDTLVMAKLGSRLAFAALSPAGGTTIAELVCDGTSYVFVDHQHNCHLTGPCDRSAIARFFHVDLSPDDFIRLALGRPPLLRDAKATSRWDAGRGYERLELVSAEGTERIAVDTRGKKLQVVEAELVEPSGRVAWSIKQAFEPAQPVPSKSVLRTPADSSDVRVEWGARLVNAPIDDAVFTLAVPPGLAICP
jgi:hypothetical protein